MANVRKPIIENPVYGEIIINLSHKPTHVRDLQNLFVDDIFDKKPTKSTPVLSKQLVELEKQGYVEQVERSDSGKNFPFNRKPYRIIWEKIIDDFLLAINDYVEFPEIKDLIEERKKTFKEKRELFKNNYFVRKTFYYIFDDFYRTRNTKETLISIFRDSIYLNLFRKINTKFLESIGYDELEFRDYDIFLEKFEKRFGIEKKTEYIIYRDFIDFIPESIKAEQYDSIREFVGNQLGRDVIGENEFSKIQSIRLKQLEQEEEMKLHYKPYFPISKDDLVSKEEAMKDLIQIEKIRKKGEQNNRKALVETITELKKKYFYVHTGFYWEKINRLPETPIWGLIKILSRLEFGVIKEYKLQKDFHMKDILMYCESYSWRKQ